jgi:hypothetical protein
LNSGFGMVVPAKMASLAKENNIEETVFNKKEG